MDHSGREELVKARRVALRLLARRPCSVVEVEARLAERRFPPDVIRRTVDHLISLGYLNDEAFARGRARYLMETRPMGRRRLAWELVKKGVGKELAETSAGEAFSELSEREVALEVARRRLQSYRGLPRQKAKGRLKGYLERRGFSLSDIIAVVDELLGE